MRRWTFCYTVFRLPGRPENERHEAEMHKETLARILEGEQGITMKTILAWHGAIFSRTDYADARALRR